MLASRGDCGIVAASCLNLTLDRLPRCEKEVG